MPLSWHLAVVLCNVLFSVSYRSLSGSEWVLLLVAGRRQEVTSKLQASRAESTPLMKDPHAGGEVETRLEEACFLIQWVEARFLGCSVQDVGQRAVSAAAWSLKRSRTWPHIGRCVSCARNGMRRRICRSVRRRSGSQSEMEEVGPVRGRLGCQGCGTWRSSRDDVSLCVAWAMRLSSVWKSQAVRGPPGCQAACGSLEPRAGHHVRVWRGAVRIPEVVAEGLCAAGGQEGRW